MVCFAQLRAGLSSVAAAVFRAASSQAWAFRAGSFGAVGCSSCALALAVVVAERAASQPSNISFKRTAAPPLNSSVRRQSISLRSSSPSSRFRLRVCKARCVVLGWPALSPFARLVVRCSSRALAHLASSFFAVRAVRRNVAFVVSGSFFARRPLASPHCRAFKAALSCWLASVLRAAV